MQPKTFLRRVFSYCLILILLIASINGFCLYHRINLHKSHLQALKVEESFPKTLLLGASRVRNIRSDSSAWPKTLQPVCSLFGPMETLSRMHAHILHALEFTSPEEIILCVDFFTFNTYNRGPPDAIDDFFLTQSLPPLGSKKRLMALYRFKIKRALRQIFSLSYFKTNSFSLYQQLASQLLETPPQKDQQPSHSETHPEAIDRLYLLESFTINETFFISPPKCFTFEPADGLASNFDTFKKLLGFLYAHNYPVKLVILPFHARFFELIHAAGLWSFYKEWLTVLIQTLETEALKTGKTAYPFYDFSGYSAYNTEYLNTHQPMTGRWYIESSHFNTDLGDLILQQLYASESKTKEGTFGKRIRSDNLAAHIHQLEHDRQSYCEQHPEAIGAIRKLYLEWKEANTLLGIRKTYEEQSPYNSQP